MEALAKRLEFLGFWREANEVRRGEYSEHTRWIIKTWQLDT